MSAVFYKIQKSRNIRRLCTALAVITLLFLANKTSAQEIEWTSLAGDGQNDGMYNGVLDGKELFYYYDAEQDRIYFRVDVYGSINTSVIGINIIMFIPGDTQVGSWWGTNTAFRYNRLVTFWVQGSPPNNYSGTIGIANAAGVAQMRYMNLKQGNIAAEVDPQNNYYVLSFPRQDLISDELFDNGPVNIDLIAAVGTNEFWNDDIPNSGNGTMTIEKGEDPKPEINLSLSDLTFAPVQQGESNRMTLTISNPSSVMLNVLEMNLEGNESSAFSVRESAPFNVAPGSSKNITVEFEPPAEGDYITFLNIVSNAAEPNSTFVVTLSGEGLAEQIDPPGINISQTELLFDPAILGAEKNASINISNDGGSDLVINSLSIEDTDKESFQIVGPAQLTIAAGQSAEVSILFSPVKEGPLQANLQILSNAPAPDNSISVLLRGSGLVDTGVRADIFENAAVSLYPNPVHEAVNISYGLKRGGMFSLRLLDERGRVVLQTRAQFHAPGMHKQRLQLKDLTLPAGALMLQILKDGRSVADLKLLKL